MARSTPATMRWLESVVSWVLPENKSSTAAQNVGTQTVSCWCVAPDVVCASSQCTTSKIKLDVHQNIENVQLKP